MVMIQSDSSGKSPFPTLRVTLVLAVAAICFVACFTNSTLHLNDQKYMVWSARHLDSAPIYLEGAGLAIPFFLGQWFYIRRPGAWMLAVGLLMISTFGLTIAFACLNQGSPRFDRIAWAAMNPADGGYFSEAARFTMDGMTAKQVLQRYPFILTRLLGHGFNKPPGAAVVCMAFVREFGFDDYSAEKMGLFLAAITTLSVPATYAFIRYFSNNRNAGFFGASFLSLCPGILLFFPFWDPFYPVFTASMTISWAMTLDSKSKWLAALFGLIFAVTMFFTYLPIALVIFLAGYTLYKWRTSANCRITQIALYSVIAIASFVVVHWLFWLWTGFNPIASFASAWHEEHLRMHNWIELTGMPARRLPGTIFWDLSCFALGSAWISYLLLGFYFIGAFQDPASHRNWPLALICVGQFVLVALLGLLAGETARIWAFMLPMLMFPIGLELSRWNPRSRLLVYAALLALTAVVFQSMKFVV
jgi:hypothetical protein